MSDTQVRQQITANILYVWTHNLQSVSHNLRLNTKCGPASMQALFLEDKVIDSFTIIVGPAMVMAALYGGGMHLWGME